MDDLNNWFTVEEIDKDTFVLSEYGHWEETHCYLVCGTERAVLIDTGLGVANIRKTVDRLTRLPVTVVTTHAHWDHIGGHRYFGDIAVHTAERGWLADKFPLPLEVVKRNLTLSPCAFPDEFQLDEYEIFHGEPQNVYKDGDRFDLGGRTLCVLHTPGHSPGHCCFYEPERRYLYAGDLIYAGCLDAFYPTTDPQLFYRSVQRLRTLDIARVFPGHHRLDIPVGLIHQIEEAFRGLEGSGALTQGAGIFDFGAFQIHI